jgi:HNH endonuclease
MAELPVYRGGKVVTTALVDGDDWLRLSRWRWQWNPRFRTIGRTKNVAGDKIRVLLPREIVGSVPGAGTTVRHRNGNTLDNRRSNLRVLRARPVRPSGVPSHAGERAAVEG